MTKDLGQRQKAGGLRGRLLGWVGALVLISLAGSTLSVYHIGQVGRSLDRINRVSVPMGRLLVQLESDAESFRREVERRVVSLAGAGHQPIPPPAWLEDVISSEFERLGEYLHKDEELTKDAGARWVQWQGDASKEFTAIRAQIASQVSAPRVDEARALIPRMNSWFRQIQWAASEHDRWVRARFSRAEAQVSELRTGLQVVLVVVVALSILALWLGERALRPLAQLSVLVRQIRERGPRREDKQALPLFAHGRLDEVGTLAREIHQMATSILEHEKQIEAREARLEEQNRLLREAGELNWDILASIESALLVTDAQGRITQCNPAAADWLKTQAESLIGRRIQDCASVQVFPELKQDALQAGRLLPVLSDDRTLGGRIIPLRSGGWIVLIEDQTEDRALQERLHQAENLAAVGRMSAQVAHEVRNPLHSIGLEAELALESAGKSSDPTVRASLQSILASVDRLQTITENYLRLSKLSSGERRASDVASILESALALYAPVCEAQGVLVDWKQVGGARARVSADRPVLDQCLGNLMSNALQALYEYQQGGSVPFDFLPRVRWTYGCAESGRVWVRVEDNGPGISDSVLPRLFQPFVTGRAQGTGLGLSFVKKVVEEHGGEIQAYSHGSDPAFPGACFEIFLPAVLVESVGAETPHEVRA